MNLHEWIGRRRAVIGFVVLAIGVIASQWQSAIIDNKRARDAEAAYVYACERRNESIRDGNETRDANADFLDGLRATITFTNPDIVHLLDEAITRNRVVIPKQNCTYPPPNS